MEIAAKPLIEAYRDALSTAYQEGFLWVVLLLARESDIDGLYVNLRKSLISLDSITGKYFLFILANKESTEHGERWDFKAIGENMNTLEKNQTIAVNTLKDFLSINERDIPCLVFTKLYSYSLDNATIHVVPISGNNVYAYFKHLLNEIDSLLKRYMVLCTRLKALDEHGKELKKRKEEVETKISQSPFQTEKKILTLQKELYLYAEQNIMDDKGQTIHDCIKKLSYGRFDKEVRRLLNRYVDMVKNYKKTTGRNFDSKLVSDDIHQSTTIIAKIKFEQPTVECEQKELEKMRADILYKIEKIIGSSKVDENTREGSRLSIVVTGGTAQINVAVDDAKIEASQYIGYDEEKFEGLVRNVRKDIPKDIPDDDIKAINSHLDVIEDELKQAKPQKSLVQAALRTLEAIKETTEFGAAVASLVQFIQPLL